MYLLKVEELFKYLLPLSYTYHTSFDQSSDSHLLHEENECKLSFLSSYATDFLNFVLWVFLKSHICVCIYISNFEELECT